MAYEIALPAALVLTGLVINAAQEAKYVRAFRLAYDAKRAAAEARESAAYVARAHREE